MLSLSTTGTRRTISQRRVGAAIRGVPLADGYWTLDDNGATWLLRRDFASGQWSGASTQYDNGGVPLVTVGGATEGDAVNNIRKYIKNASVKMVESAKPIATTGYDFKDTGGVGLPAQEGGESSTGLLWLGVGVLGAFALSRAVR